MWLPPPAGPGRRTSGSGHPGWGCSARTGSLSVRGQPPQQRNQIKAGQLAGIKAGQLVGIKAGQLVGIKAGKLVGIKASQLVGIK